MLVCELKDEVQMIELSWRVAVVLLLEGEVWCLWFFGKVR